MGSHLCDRLVRDGHWVIATDNFMTGSRANVAHLIGEDRFALVEHDVREPWSTEAHEGPLDRVFNLACPASPRHYQARPIETTMTCVLGARNALELCAQKKARMLQASTSEIYGDPLVHPQPETYRGFVNQIGPRACYDEGKRVAETLCYDYARTRGVDARIARIFNTYGPRMDEHDGRVVSNFIVQALREEPLTVYGDGTQTRSFCYIDDLVEGLVRLMNHPDEAGPINIGSDGEYTMLELAAIVREQTASTSVLVHRPRPADDPARRKPDLARARDKLDFTLKVALREGIRRTVLYFRQQPLKGIRA